MPARIIIGAFILGLCGAGCGASGSDAGAELATGDVMVSVDAVTAIGELNTVTVSVSPAGIVDESLTYDSGTFTGTLVVPAGDQMFTVEAFVDTDLVGRGTASATVVQGETATILITVLDTTGPQPGVDHGPVITSLVIPQTETRVDEVISLSAESVDVDGDTLSYQWTDDCTTTTFTDPTAATTDWSNSTIGACELSLTVTANGLSTRRTFTMVTGAAGTGTVNIEAAFIPNPVVTDLWVRGGDFDCEKWYDGNNATCSGSVSPSQFLAVSVWTQFDTQYGEQTVSVSDNCGGLFSNADNFGDENYWEWNAPDEPAVCMITATATNEGLSSEFSVVVVVEE